MSTTSGTGAIKSVILFITLAVQKGLTIDANGDKKISFAEILSTLTTLSFKIPELVEAIPAVRAEWKDLTQQEREELIAWFGQTFDLPAAHDKTEAIIKRALHAVNYNVDFYRDMKTLLSGA